MSLDSPPQIIAELESCNKEIAEFADSWAREAGELREAERRHERLFRSALRGTEGRNAEERQATAYAAVDIVEPGLAGHIEELIGNVEAYKVRFKTIDRRSNNAQSLLALHKESARLESFQPKAVPGANAYNRAVGAE